MFCRYSPQMSEKSAVYCLPLLFCNEAKYEDCVRILDMYIAELSRLYTEAFGELHLLLWNLSKSTI